MSDRLCCKKMNAENHHIPHYVSADGVSGNLVDVERTIGQLGEHGRGESPFGGQKLVVTMNIV